MSEMPARKKPGGAASATAKARPSSADAPGSMSSALLAAAEGSSTDAKPADGVDGKPVAEASEPKEGDKPKPAISEAKTLPATPHAKSGEAAAETSGDAASNDTEVEASVEEKPAEEKQAEEDEPAAPAVDQSIFVRVFGRTDVGQVREHNEDNFLVADLSKGSRGLMETDRLQLVGDRGTVLGVCDGMGGAAAGEVASQLAVDIVYQRMLAGDPPKDRDDVASRLVAAIESAGNRIFAEAKADRTRRGMGTTATIAGLIDGYLFLGQVGDSRGYLLRGDRLVQVTRDQSLVNQLIEAGQLTEEEAETFEHNNIILQALGTADTVQVDLTYVDLRKGDTLLLCSDGLSGMVRNDEIREVLSTFEDPLEACRELTDRANQAGGHDNVTVVVAKFEGPGLVDPTPEEITGLKYRKYELPELATRSSDGAPHGVRSSMRPGKAGPDIEVGYDEYDGDLANDSLRAEDPVELPREQAPSWIVTMMIVSAVTCVVVVGYYLLR